MIVLSEISQPESTIRVAQPQVQAYLEGNCAGDGKLYIAEKCVTWIERHSGKGFSLSYQAIILHALATDITSFPHECIYVLVDCSKADRPRRRNFPLYTAQEAQNVQDLNLAGDELDEDGSDADSDSPPSVQIRFVPSDPSCLQEMYDELSACQELNPDDEALDDSDMDEMEPIMEGGEETEGRWFTAEDMASGDFELSTEGMANLQRMMGSPPRHNGHATEDSEDHEQMDE